MTKFKCGKCYATTFASGNPRECGRCGHNSIMPVEERAPTDVPSMMAELRRLDGTWNRFDRERAKWERELKGEDDDA